jgi:putative DNA methylase
MTSYRKKLIEVALPVEEISKACRRDKDRKVGTIKNVHKWFAPTPTPAWRALLFAALVDDPGDDRRRNELVDLIKRLVPEDGGPPPESALDEARRVIGAAGGMPTVFDPFCGGGSALVEAQRLGLEAVGSDLNPVAALIARTISQLVPAVAGHPPVHPEEARIPGVSGGPLDDLITDLRHYAVRLRGVAWAQVGHLYPTLGGETVIAWLWARTAGCPNPACGATIPLYTSPWLSRQKGKERWLKPIVAVRQVTFEIGEGAATPPPVTKASRRGARFRCPICQQTAPEEHIKSEGVAGRLGTQLLATVVHGDAGRRHLRADRLQAQHAAVEPPEDRPDVAIPFDPRNLWCREYGIDRQFKLYTTRQLHTLGAFADTVAKVHSWVIEDGGDDAYATAITTILGLCVGKLAQANSTLARWKIDSRNGIGKPESAFSRHALPMVWDFVEVNPFGGSVGDWLLQINTASGALRTLPPHAKPARVVQCDAREAGKRLVLPETALVATDPPYYDQIGYADLSDYFYVWERRALRDIQPDLFGTIAAPKAAELIATPYRHQDADAPAAAARKYFVEGFTDSLTSLASAARADLPMVVIYALRQEEVEMDGQTSTAWDAIIEALLAAGLGIVGAWPIHGTASSRQMGLGTNALASYTAMVCRPRTVSEVVDRPGFLRALRAGLPAAIRRMQEAAVPPLDLTQAALGPGLAVFSRFAQVIEPTGEPMSVRTAIAIINQVRGEALSRRQDAFDADTRWAVQWFDEYGFMPGDYGRAEVAFTAADTSFDRLRRAGIVASRPPKLWLLRPQDLSARWDPRADGRVPVWELTMHLVRRLYANGEEAAGELLATAIRRSDSARDLAYRLADICERRGWADEARVFNGLIVAWPEIARRAAALGRRPYQETLG